MNRKLRNPSSLLAMRDLISTVCVVLSTRGDVKLMLAVRKHLAAAVHDLHRH